MCKIRYFINSRESDALLIANEMRQAGIQFSSIPTTGPTTLWIDGHAHYGPTAARCAVNELVESKLLTSINESRWILELNDNWDDGGSCSYKEEVWERARKFLFKLAVESAKKYSFTIFIPSILPGPDGSIDLHWKMNDYEFLVNIPDRCDQPVYWCNLIGEASDS